MKVRRFRIVPFPVTLGPLVFWAHVSSYGQVYIDSTWIGRPITQIDFVGNTRTKTHVLRREMKERVEEPFHPDRLEADRKRLLNLRLFNRVQIFGEPDGEGVRLVVRVTEQWPLFPYPIVFPHHRDWDRLSYGAGVIHVNFRGRAEWVSLSLVGGFDPSIQFAYTNPWLTDDRTWRGNFLFAWNQIRNKHVRDRVVEEDHLASAFTVGRWFGYHTIAAVTLGFRWVRLPPLVLESPSIPASVDLFPEMEVSWIWDHRDLAEYVHSGFLISLSLLKRGIPNRQVDVTRGRFDLRAYLPLYAGWTLAARLDGTFSRGRLPLYDRVYLGYDERIRGCFRMTREGRHRLIGSVALRFPLLVPRYFHLGSQAGLRDLRFGIGGGFFADQGAVWEDRPGRFLRGAGAGLHFLLPYQTILRIESAWDARGRQEWILDLNADL